MVHEARKWASDAAMACADALVADPQAVLMPWPEESTLTLADVVVVTAAVNASPTKAAAALAACGFKANKSMISKQWQKLSKQPLESRDRDRVQAVFESPWKSAVPTSLPKRKRDSTDGNLVPPKAGEWAGSMQLRSASVSSSWPGH
jgi:hypothetical protein